MKKLANKALRLIFPLLLVVGTGILSKFNNFNFMNYEFMPPKLLLVIIFLIMLLGLSINRNKIYNLLLDGRYLYQLHYLLIIIWIFLFFYYKYFYISLITILFNFIILFLMFLIFSKYKKSLFYVLYLIWFMYLVVINLLILL